MDIQWKKYKVQPGKDIKLSETATYSGLTEPDTLVLKTIQSKDTEILSKLQYKLYAENRQSLLIVLQGMDSSGKDGAIKHVMNGVNPQGVLVHSFKHPSTLELEHDYLWRHYQKLPERGEITIFNRSHYENVIISRVHPEIVLAERIPGINSTDKINAGFWSKRYDQINDFEKIITQNGTHIIKLFLHLSKDEQRNRFLKRIENKEKNWKFSSADITERGFWDQYQHVYEKAIKHTSTKTAPWYVVPADDKWYTRLLISKIIIEKLQRMDPSFPPVEKEEEELLQLAKESLSKE